MTLFFALSTLTVASVVQQMQFIAADGAAGDGLGVDVAIDGDTALVGASGVNTIHADQGAAYVFVRAGGVWVLEQKLVHAAGAASDFFGNSVDLDGDTALIGAQGEGGSRGAAYVWVRAGGVWTQQARLLALGGVPGDGLGTSAALDGDTALVGALSRDVGPNANQGAAYVFVRTGAVWTQQQELTAPDGLDGDQFGSGTAIVGDTAVVGAWFDDVGLDAEQGSAYVFVRSGGAWTFQAQLVDTGGAGNDQFGASVAMDGGTIIAGAPGRNANQGAAFVFVGSGATWTQQAVLVAAGGQANDFFGQGIALDGDTAVVGGYFHDVGLNADQGTAYVFVRSGTSWSQFSELVADDGAANDTFALRVALDNGTALAGANRHQVGLNAGQGSAYAYAGLPAVTPGGSLSPCPTPLPTGPPPIITAFADQAIPINGQAGPLPFKIDGRIIPYALRISAESSDPVLVSEHNLMFARQSFFGDWTLTVRPSDGRRGTAVITVTVSDGCFTTSRRFQVYVGNPPAAPATLAVTPSGTAGAMLTWMPPTTGTPPERYVLSGTRVGYGSLPVAVTRDGSTTRLEVGALPPGTYTFVAYGLNPTGLGPPSEEVTLDVTGPADIPAPPFGFRVIAEEGGRVTGTWDDPGYGAPPVAHQFDVGPDPGWTLPLTTLMGNPVSGTPDASLWVQARATSGGRVSVPSLPLFIGVDTGCIAPPAVPMMLPAMRQGDRVTLAWLPATGAVATDYRVEIAPGLGMDPVYAVMTANSGSSYLLVLPAGTTAAARVIATNACGSSVPSQQVEVPK